MSKTLIQFKNLSFAYHAIKPFSFKKVFSKAFAKTKIKTVALENINFSINKGEIIGIVGENGSGKTTLLKLLAGVLGQDKGEIVIHEPSSISLISIGTGFLGKLSGRQNIMLSGLLLGFSKQEILQKEAEIIDFAGIGEAIDKPVSTYSSGMYSKLAFSINAFLATDVILIDEILSVGDQKFRQKSHAKILEIIKSKERTVIIVSHNNSMIRELCDRVVWIHRGHMQMIGPTEEVMSKYLEFMS